MKWVELSVDAPSEYVEPISYLFYRYGHGGVATEEPAGHNPDEGEAPPAHDLITVKTYVPMDSSIDERRGRIDLGVRLIGHLTQISPLRERILEEDEWESSWKKHFKVLRVGRRIVIVPTWIDHRANKSDVVIELDPGMAFGTGHHPTTRMCLELLEDHIRPGVDALDVGCGSGILSIAAAKLGAGRVLGLEIEKMAAEVAESNVRQNGVSRTVRVGHGTLPDADTQAHSYDIAVANISSKVISELRRRTRPRGQARWNPDRFRRFA